MNKLEENVQRVVASKVLKDIDEIVKSDLEKQKEERFSSILVVVLFSLTLVFIIVLSFVLL